VLVIDHADEQDKDRDFLHLGEVEGQCQIWVL
jgi:hypothetical protein